MLTELQIGKLYRYIPTRNIAVVSGVRDSEIHPGGKVYRLIYLNDPDRVYNLGVKNSNQQIVLWEEVRNDVNWDCYNSSLAC